MAIGSQWYNCDFQGNSSSSFNTRLASYTIMAQRAWTKIFSHWPMVFPHECFINHWISAKNRAYKNMCNIIPLPLTAAYCHHLKCVPSNVYPEIPLSLSLNSKHTFTLLPYRPSHAVFQRKAHFSFQCEPNARQGRDCFPPIQRVICAVWWYP